MAKGDNNLPGDNSRVSVGKRGEHIVAEVLSRMGYEVIRTTHTTPYDMLVNGKRVEVKTATLNKFGVWFVSIKRDSGMKEDHVDLYIFRLESRFGSKGYCSAVHLVVPSPVGVANVQFTPKSLLTKWRDSFERFDLFGEPKAGLPKSDGGRPIGLLGARTMAIIDGLRDGSITRAELARKHRVSRQRVSQIASYIAKSPNFQNPEVTA